MEWFGKRVMVTGGDGMIGQELVEILLTKGAEVHVMDIKRGNIYDCRDFSNCISNINFFKPEYIFHLCGVKGNVWKTQHEPASFIAEMLRFDTNMIVAAQECKVSHFLYTSSIAVENMETDMYPAWAKMTGEKLIEAMMIQYNDTEWVRVRPANVYGRFDDYKTPEKRGMVISSLISKALKPGNTFDVWGDGSDIRDFINAKDVARGMIQAMEEGPPFPVNLCSGQEVTIRELATLIAERTGKDIFFDESKPRGAPRRVMKINWNFEPKITLAEGIKECVEYARK